MVPVQGRSSAPMWSVVLWTLVLLMSQRYISLVLSHDAAGAGICSSWPPPCSQLCNETSTGVRCACVAGFYLAADERHCQANRSTSVFELNGGSAFLLYNSGNNILATAFDSFLSTASDSPSSFSSSSSPTTIYEGRTETEIVNFAMALEISTGRIFFSNDEEVVQVIEAKTRRTLDLIVNGLNVVSSLALDWVTSVLYISDSGLHKILACSTSSRQCSEIVEVHMAFFMDIDAINGKLYWSDCSLSGKIDSSNMDGSGHQTVKQDVSCARSLKVDRPTQTLYWTNQEDDHIHMCQLSTGICRLLPSSDFLYMICSIAVFEDDLIWTTSMSEDTGFWRDEQTSILSADKFNYSMVIEQPNTIVKNIPKVPSALHVWHSAMQVPSANPCSKKQCSHLCLQSKLPGGAKCACPSGMVIGDDQHNCEIDWSMPSIVFISQNELHSVSVDFVGGKAGEAFFKVGESVTITALNFDYSTRAIYLSCTGMKGAGTTDHHYHSQGAIMRIDLTRKPYTGEMMFSTGPNVTDLEVDWISRNVYWVDHDAGAIEVASIDGLSRTVLTGDNGSGVTEKPRAIAVDPQQKRLFYSDCGTSPHIGSCDLAGHSCKSDSIKFEKGSCVTELFLDRTFRVIYFIIGNRIMVTDLDLKGVVVHRHSLRPNSLATFMDLLYWTDDSYPDIRFTDDDVEVHYRKIRVNANQNRLGPLIIFSDLAQPEGSNGCGNDQGGCSDICLVDGSDTVTCLCHTGTSLNADGVTCSSDTKGMHQKPQRILKKPTSANMMAQTALVRGQVSTIWRPRVAHDASSMSPSFRGMLTSIALRDVTAMFVPCPCRNGGSCESRNGFVKCLCPPGFSGGFCDEREEAIVIKSPSQSFEGNFHMYIGAALGAMAIVIATMVAIICFIKPRRSASSGRLGEDQVQIKSSGNSAIEMGCVNDSTLVSLDQNTDTKGKS